MYIPFIMVLYYGLNQLLIFLRRIIWKNEMIGLFSNCPLFIKLFIAVCMVSIVPLSTLTSTCKELYCKIYNLFTFPSKRSKNGMDSSIFSKHLLKMKAIHTNGCKKCIYILLERKS